MIKRLEASRGEAHPDTVYALSKLGQLYEIQERIDEAIDVCKVAYERAKIKLTVEHPMTKDIAIQLEELLHQRKRNGAMTQNAEASEPSPVTPMEMTNRLYSSKTF